MSLTNPMAVFNVYTCDIWTGNQSAAYDPEFSSPPVQLDFNSSYTLSASGIKCLYWPTPNFDDSTDAGRTKENNIFTSDKWEFDISVSMESSDIIICTGGPTNFSLINRAWTIEGNAEAHDTLPLIQTQMVYAIIEPCPKDINVYYGGNIY